MEVYLNKYESLVRFAYFEYRMCRYVQEFGAKRVVNLLLEMRNCTEKKIEKRFKLVINNF